jgi:hypothetical protein
VLLIEAVQILEEQLLRQVLQDIRGKKVTPLKVYSLVNLTLRMKKHVTKTMSFLPCMYFLNNFSNTVFTVLYRITPYYFIAIKENISTKHQNFIFWFISQSIGLEGLANLVEMSWLCFKVSKICNQSRESLEVLESRIMFETSRQDWTRVFQKIEEAKRFEYEAWDFFSINKTMLLSFIGSLISFTVLLVQLILPMLL